MVFSPSYICTECQCKHVRKGYNKKACCYLSEICLIAYFDVALWWKQRWKQTRLFAMTAATEVLDPLVGVGAAYLCQLGS